jgi:hypothetical protein
MTGHRIEPTPEDLAIHGRAVKRLLRWSAQENAKRDRTVTGPMLCDITRRAMMDAMHFGPKESP